jgi:transcription antitermination factor NusG
MISSTDRRTARWYAVYVRSHYEKAVKESLEGKGYSAFSPCYRLRRKRADRTKEVVLPLFPGYVFCQFDASVRMPILTTQGVVRIVGSTSDPEPVDDTEISSIQALVKSDRPIQPWPYLRAGQRVRIIAGPLTGTMGTLLQVKNDYRLVASITLLQRSVAVEIENDSVVPVSSDVDC